MNQGSKLVKKGTLMVAFFICTYMLTRVDNPKGLLAVFEGGGGGGLPYKSEGDA